MRVARACAVATGLAVALAGCSKTVEVLVANPCGIELEVVVVNAVVEDASSDPRGFSVKSGRIQAGGAAMVGSFADGYERTMFVEELGYRLVFHDEDLAASESTLVIPADLCPVG